MSKRPKLKDEPLKIDMSYEDALRHILKAKPIHRKKPRKAKPRRSK